MNSSEKSLSNEEILLEDFNRILSTQQNRVWKKLQNKKILITGAAGFIGSYLIKYLIFLDNKFDLNLKIFCIIRSNESKTYRLKEYSKNKKIKFIIQDLSVFNTKNIPKYDFCFYGASKASPIYYKTDPIGTIKPNIVGLISVLEKAEKKSNIIFLSSGEVYGQCKTKKIVEDSMGYLNPMDLRACYGESKRMGENICSSYFHQNKLDIKVVRPFHTYGPGLSETDGRVFADFIHAVAKGRNIELTSDGSSKRPFCYISDLISALFIVAFKGESGEAYNIANPDQELSIKNLAKLVTGLRKDKKLKIIHKKPRKDYLQSPISRQIVSIEKIKKLRWAPTVDVNTGFSRSILFES